MVDRLVLNQGERLLLQCAIDSNPLCHQIRWLHNDREILTQSCTANNRTQIVAEYLLPRVYRIHSGKYTCEVKNWLNKDLDSRSEATAQVSTEVRIQCKENNELFHGGRSLGFRCSLHSQYHQETSDCGESGYHNGMCRGRVSQSGHHLVWTVRSTAQFIHGGENPQCNGYIISIAS